MDHANAIAAQALNGATTAIKNKSYTRAVAILEKAIEILMENPMKNRKQIATLRKASEDIVNSGGVVKFGMRKSTGKRKPGRPRGSKSKRKPRGKSKRKPGRPRGSKSKRKPGRPRASKSKRKPRASKSKRKPRASKSKPKRRNAPPAPPSEFPTGSINRGNDGLLYEPKYVNGRKRWVKLPKDEQDDGWQDSKDGRWDRKFIRTMY